MPLTVESFTVSMRDLQTRHPNVKNVEFRGYFPSSNEMQFMGSTADHFDFLLRFIPEDDMFPDEIDISIVMRTNTNLSDRSISRKTIQMHWDIPGTESMELYLLEHEDGLSAMLGCTIALDESVTVGDMDSLFASLCKAAPKVSSQFFQGAWVHMKDRKPL